MKLSGKLYIIIFILCFNFSPKVQADPVIDSLMNRLSQEQDPVKKSKTYFDLIDLLIKTDVDSAKYYLNQGLFHAKKNDLVNETGMFYSSLGDVYVMKNDLSAALDNYLNAIQLYKVSGNYTGLSNVYLGIGNIYLTQANFSAALENYQRGLKIADSLNIERLLPHFFNNIGELYSDLESYEDAIKYYKKAQEFHHNRHDSINEASNLNNIGQVYIKLGDIENAKNYLDRAYKIYENTSYNKGLYDIFIAKGNIEQLSGNPEQALMNYLEAFKYLNKIGIKYFGPKSSLYAEVYYYLSHTYLQMHNYAQAKEYLIKAEENAGKVGKLELLSKTNHDLSELYEATNKPAEALSFYKLFKKYSDSIAIEQNHKKIMQLNLQNQFEKILKRKEQETLMYKERNRRKEILYLIIIIGVFVLLIVLGLLWNTQRLKRKNLFLEKEKLRSELEYKNKELTTNVLYLLRKNEFVINIIDQLKSIRYSAKPENRKIVDSVIKQMEQNTSKDIWKEFEIRFQDVHSDFYKKLLHQYPDLSPNELKLCAFLRLNMSTKEISSITFQSYNSIIMARHRLRKKLNISSNENLITFLRQL